MSRGPAKTRKSPIRHTVRTHKRLGLPIQSYVRGHGDKPKLEKREHRRVGLGAGYGENPGDDTQRLGDTGKYTATLYYSGFKREAFEIDSSDYEEAMRQGFTQSEIPGPPEKVKVRYLR